ncbi:MAG: Methyltransferase type 11 [Bacteroidetes bacterium]|nr:Methyltransferase type 11 [Bacteroidota bacterium]
MKERWDERYSIADYVYGEEPNLYFKEVLGDLVPGRILLPADGEGRNGVYAATQGWGVDAFDQSDQARDKALQLAERKGVNICYQVIDFKQIYETYPKGSFDAIALVFAHMPKEIKADYFPQLPDLLKAGGHILLEGFSKNHVTYQQKNPGIGGPLDVEMMYSKELIRELFPSLEIIALFEQEISLNEGLGHNGIGSVIRYIGKKRNGE